MSYNDHKIIAKGLFVVKKFKMWFCFVLAILLMLGTLPVGDFAINANAASVMNTTYRNSKGYELAVFPIGGDFHVTQLWNGSYSHSNQLAIDCLPLTAAGGVNSSARLYAPFTGKIVATVPSWGCVVFQSNAPVQYADGTVDIMTVVFGHDNNSENYQKNKTIAQGNELCAPGTAGGYDYHTHIFVIKGTWEAWTNGGYKNAGQNSSASGGGNVIPTDAFFFDSDWSIDWTQTSKSCYYPQNKVNWTELKTFTSSSHIEISYDCHCRLEVTETDKHIMTLPCSNKTDTKSDSVEAVAKGDKLEAIELIFNSQDNYWYKVISEKTGKTGYIYAGNVEWIAHKTTDVTGPGISVPANHTQGKSYPLSGRVTATNSELTKVSVYIYPGTKTSGTSETGYSQSVSGKSFTLGGSAIDSNTVFNILGEGQHTYVVTASCKYHYATSGTTKGMKTVDNIRVYTQTFNVVSGSSTPSVQEPTTILYPTSGGVFKIASGVGNNMYLDFACTSDNVQIYENCDNHSDPNFVISQYYQLTHVGDGWYSIINIGNGMAMDVDGANVASGTNIHQWAYDGNNAQLFRFYDAGNGYCYIKSKLGTYVDVANGDSVNNTNVWAYSFNGSNAQKWKLESHSHSYTSTITTNPTCKTDGIRTYKCSCGASYSTNIGKHAATHEGGTEIRNVRAATCKENGYTGDTYCKGCGVCLGFGTSIAKKDHTEVIDNAVAESCVTTGLTEGKHCSVCGLVIVAQTLIPAFGHNYDYVVIPPTCTKDGYSTFTCINCGDRYTAEYVPAAHSYVDGKCSVCGDLKIITSGSCGENLNWTLYANGKLSIVGSGAMAKFEQMSDVPWHSYRISIKEIVIEDGVTSISSESFRNCFELLSIDIPNSITSIGDYAFCNCTNLANIIIPDGVKHIGTAVFNDCISLKSVTIPNGVTNIGDEAFASCYALTDVDMPDSITSIGKEVFYGCSSLTSVEIPDGITNIESGAFQLCSSLTEVHFGNNVVSIGDNAFAYCSALTSIDIPDSVTNLGTRAFENCKALTGVNIGSGITTINASAFYGCSALSAVDIPDNITIIGDSAFSFCSALTSVNIPDSIISIGAGAFQFCNVLSEIHLGDHIESIGDNAFAYCYALTSVDVPDSVTSFGTGIFESCTSLAEVSLGKGITDIPAETFCFCSSLACVSIPKSVKAVGDNAFAYCSALTDVYYDGSEEEWNDIEIGSNNEPLIYANIHFDSHLSAEDHNYAAVVTAPSCTEDGYTTHTCMCGDTYIDNYVDATGHKYKTIETAPSCGVDGYITYVCTVCGDSYDGPKIPALKHIYSGEITTEPTCTEEGIKTYTCSRCGKYFTERIAVIEHTPGMAVMENKVVATCMTDGSYDMVTYCAICNEKLSSMSYVITASGHTPGANATCTEDQTCTVCGDVLTEKLGHDYAAVVTAPTCIENGYTTHTCTACGDSYIADEVSAIGHDYIGVVTTEPDCLVPGVKTFTCANCSDVYTEEIVALGHTPGATATCTEDQTCTVCGDVLTEKLGHDYAAVVTAPTCTEKGYTTNTCTVCGDSYVSDEVKADGHDYAAVVTPPTCEKDGYTTYTCTVCEHSYTADYVSGEHTDADGDEYCDHCDEYIEKEDPSAKCSHLCHNTGIMGIFWKIIRFFFKLFKINPVCTCGAAHY